MLPALSNVPSGRLLRTGSVASSVLSGPSRLELGMTNSIRRKELGSVGVRFPFPKILVGRMTELFPPLYPADSAASGLEMGIASSGEVAGKIGPCRDKRVGMSGASCPDGPVTPGKRGKFTGQVEDDRLFMLL
ncbi:hypothetical protein NL676_030271 [Syzygium grande]|nr:hypothetical protein NL676_030271 [Syzygium grande]